MINISDFTSALELAATLNMAFILAEYTNSYSLLVLKKFFRFNELLKELDCKCRSYIDGNSADSLVVHIIDGFSTQDKIEEIKRKISKRKDSLEKSKCDFQNRFENECNAKSFSYISLYMSLYCILSLLLAKFTELYDYIYMTWSLFSGFSLLWMIASFLWGENESNWLKVNYCSLKSCTKSFLIIIILCFLVAFSIMTWFPTINVHNTFIEWFVVLSTILLPYLGFVVFIYKVWKVGKLIVCDMREFYNNEESLCKEISDEIDTYSKLDIMTIKLSATTG